MKEKSICKVDEYGTKFWYLNGKFHRMDGPAIEYWFDCNQWWFNGKFIDCATQKEFDYYIKWKAFL